MMMLPAVMPREALRRLGQACAVRLVASNASTSIALVLYRAPTSPPPRNNKLELIRSYFRGEHSNNKETKNVNKNCAVRRPLALQRVSL